MAARPIEYGILSLLHTSHCYHAAADSCSSHSSLFTQSCPLRLNYCSNTPRPVKPCNLSSQSSRHDTETSLTHQSSCKVPYCLGNEEIMPEVRIKPSMTKADRIRRRTSRVARAQSILVGVLVCNVTNYDFH